MVIKNEDTSERAAELAQPPQIDRDRIANIYAEWAWTTTPDVIGPFNNSIIPRREPGRRVSFGPRKRRADGALSERYRGSRPVSP
jgi:hypothetical protein